MYRDLEEEIEKFERVCAELNESHGTKIKPVLKKKEKPKVPPKPKIIRFQPAEINDGGTEV